jgi:hypothetical protein
MNRLKELIKGTPVHERRLELRTYPLENDQLIVEGWLRDERLIQGFHWNGERRQPGVVHLMCVRMLIGGWPVTILDAEAEMSETPHELCPSTLEGVKKIIGLYGNTAEGSGSLMENWETIQTLARSLLRKY